MAGWEVQDRSAHVEPASVEHDTELRLESLVSSEAVVCWTVTSEEVVGVTFWCGAMHGNSAMSVT